MAPDILLHCPNLQAVILGIGLCMAEKLCWLFSNFFSSVQVGALAKWVFQKGTMQQQPEIGH